MTTDILSIASEVLTIEEKGLATLREGINEPTSQLSQAFRRTLSLIEQVKGRVIVSGMGKSGHIGRKIAATFASTGQPASFVHPGEASHGDLGMISEHDLVIAISNSGETSELSDLLLYCQRFDIPLVAITGGADSALAKAADEVLLLPKAKEACVETNAPTTSTTMTLALGDVLAVAMLRSRGFGRDDFKIFHPGGKLGAALKKVEDMVTDHRRLPIVSSGVPVSDALEVLTDAGFGTVGVVDAEGHLCGIITDGDLRRHMGIDPEKAPVDDIMTRQPKVVTRKTLAAEALNIMTAGKITSLFMVEDDKPVGLLHIHDCLSLGVI
ncbi:KpsF/GutQ family sugar-phosphate isomerase [Parvularcula sp. ZS-1/3]|uniref:KpsF/GutQ family sugar-phosphate isomerase n=1 Tax=Parvularcula mediterranea TaxID=2732508 RepID=A0A7Y3RIJ6_9PROT|nr:KpsF/GutQ family sugar-phosphate isomerase [Parvularcula mediterranea]NNU14703.1 KpsF/GutQ family sugar-phosphate isomerase [Parvularcula mediterranea]